MFETLFTGFVGAVCAWFFTDFAKFANTRISPANPPSTTCASLSRASSTGEMSSGTRMSPSIFALAERRRTRQDGGSRRAVDQRTAEGRALYHDRIEKLLRIRSDK